jgi:hypothetical protein
VFRRSSALQGPIWSESPINSQNYFFDATNIDRILGRRLVVLDALAAMQPAAEPAIPERRCSLEDAAVEVRVRAVDALNAIDQSRPTTIFTAKVVKSFAATDSAIAFFARG